jgi:hypothetical protein
MATETTRMTYLYIFRPMTNHLLNARVGKRMLRVLFPGMIAVWMTAVAAAQSIPQGERVLIPIFLKSVVPGAHGSLWTSHLVITNRSDQSVGVGGILGPLCPFGPCVDPTFFSLRASTTIFARPASTVLEAFPPTSFLLIEEDRWQDLAFSLRIQDLSRQELTWGTEIPVIHESDAFVGPVDLLDIPVGMQFRVLLRAYDFDPDDGHRVRITGYEIDPAVVRPPEDPQVLKELFSIEQDLIVYHDPLRGYAQVDLTAALVALPHAERLRIRVEPLAEGMRFWTFISVTNNETQHVTTITPR